MHIVTSFSKQKQVFQSVTTSLCHALHPKCSAQHTSHTFRLGLFAAATVGGPNVAATRAGVSAKFSDFATVSASGRGSIHSSDIRSVNKSVFYPFLVKTLTCLRNQRVTVAAYGN